MDENEQSEVKPVSIQRIEANRLNALKSTGPKTPEGKANVRRLGLTSCLWCLSL